jgi:hypothetical protein
VPSKKQTRSCELNAGLWFLEEFEVWLWGTAGSGVASTQRLHTVMDISSRVCLNDVGMRNVPYLAKVVAGV